jgi:tetratricopeptide (TPR) repeat protein
MKKNRGKKAPGKIKEIGETKARGEGKFRRFLPALFLAVGTFLAYAVSLNGTWAFDDTAIGQFASIENALNLHLGYRKIAYLSFLVNRWIDPLSPVNYRVTNILIHIVNALLVYAVAFRTMNLSGWREKYGRYGFSVALLSSVIFAFHPININAVAYIVQRMTSLATMFVLLALLCYLLARTSHGATRAAILYLLAGICVLLGIFSKENAVMAVPLIILYDFMFLSVSGTKRFPIKAVAALAAGLLLLGAASVVLHFQTAAGGLVDAFLHPFRPIVPQNWTAIDVYWTPVQHVLTECRIVARYLFLLLLPLPKFLVFDWWGFPVSKGLTEPATTVLSLFLIIGLTVFSVRKRKVLPFLSFGLLWYFIALSLESFVAVGSDLYFEHRNYLPLAGLVFGVTAQAVVALAAEAPKRKTVWAVACALALVLGGLTFQRNLVWKDSVTLWQDTVDKTKGNLRAMVALGNAYLKISDLNSAKMYYRDAMKLSVEQKRPHLFEDAAYSLGMVSLFTEDLDQAKKVIAVMNSRLEDSVRTSILKGFYGAVAGDFKGAIAKYRDILPKTDGTDRVIVYTLLGDAYRKMGSPDEALNNYKKAVEIDPSFAAAYYGMGEAYLLKRDLAHATLFLNRTLTMDPGNVLAMSEMADILLTEKISFGRAKELASRAVAASPVFHQPYLTMGSVLIVGGNEAEAEEYFKKAKDRGAEDYMIPFVKARSYYLKGDSEKMRLYIRELLAMRSTPENIRSLFAGKRTL